MYINTAICSECGGKCCKAMPGACFPSDFKLPGNTMLLDAALKSGRYTIDWWEGDPRKEKEEYPRGYFVRPAIKGKEGILIDPTWGGECTFLAETGCQLDEDARPLNCKNLEPIAGGNCKIHGNTGKQGAAIAWLPYYEKLAELVKSHNDKSK